MVVVYITTGLDNIDFKLFILCNWRHICCVWCCGDMCYYC